MTTWRKWRIWVSSPSFHTLSPNIYSWYEEKKNIFVFVFVFAAFNLIEGINVPAIEAKIAKYQNENSEQITINRARKVLEI